MMSASAEPWMMIEDYPALPTSTSIRVVTVKREPEPPWISCSMAVLDLEDNPNPLYNCLSYTWGDPIYQENDEPQPQPRPQPSYQIPCDDKVISITQNLYHALETLSRVAETYTSSIWVDAICINQLDLEERSGQVRMMGRIYSSAETVVAWLGPEDASTTAAFHVIETLARAEVNPQYSSDRRDPFGHFVGINSSVENETVYSRLRIPVITGDEWLSYFRLLERSYWSRSWTLQESYLARHLIFYCGAHHMEWDNLRAHHGTLRSLLWFERSLAMTTAEFDINTDMPVVTGPSEGYYMARDQIHAIGNHRSSEAYYKERNHVSRPKIDVEGSIQKFQSQTGSQCRGRRASDARDTIFSKLGISQFRSIFPDYTKSVKRTFTDITRSVQEESDSFSLAFVEDHAVRRVPELPSWVPDYSTVLLPQPFSSKGGSYHASKGLSKVVVPTLDPDVLGVQGIEVGHITHMGGTYQNLASGESLLQYLHIVQGLDLVYHNGHDRIEAFWRTLIGNRTGAGPEKPNDKWIPSFRATMTMMAILVCKETVTRGSDFSEESVIRALQDGESRILEVLSNHYPAVKNLCDTITTLAESDPTGPFPTCAQVSQAWRDQYEAIRDASGLEAMLTVFKDAYSYANALKNFLPWRRLFRTQTGYIGIGAKSLQVGDSIFLVQGSGEPWILRSVEGDGQGAYIFVGSAYVHGIMDGELVESLKDSFHRVEIR